MNTQASTGHWSILTRPFSGNCGKAGKIDIYAPTEGARSHVNINWNVKTWTIHPDDVKALRDALIELYPLEAKPAPKPKYVAKRGSISTGWFVEETAVRENSRTLVQGLGMDDAQAIAAAMNAQSA